MESREHIIERCKIDPEHRDLLEGVSSDELITSICVIKRYDKSIPKIRKLLEGVSSYNKGKVFRLVEAYNLNLTHSMLHTQRETDTEKISKDKLIELLFYDHLGLEHFQKAKKITSNTPGCEKFSSTASLVGLAHAIDERGEDTMKNAISQVESGKRKRFLKQLSRRLL